MNAPLAEKDPRQATTDVVEGALELVRAELRLLRSYAKGVARQAGLAVALGWVAITLGQVALVLTVLSPILFSVRPWPLVVFSILLCLTLAAAAGGLAVWSLRSVRQVLEPRKSLHDGLKHPLGGTGGN